jgi:hypothetical protein
MIDQGSTRFEMCLPTCDGMSCSRVSGALFFSCQDTRRYERSPRKPGFLTLPVESDDSDSGDD